MPSVTPFAVMDRVFKGQKSRQPLGILFGFVMPEPVTSHITGTLSPEKH